MIQFTKEQKDFLITLLSQITLKAADPSSGPTLNMIQSIVLVLKTSEEVKEEVSA